MRQQASRLAPTLAADYDAWLGKDVHGWRVLGYATRGLNASPRLKVRCLSCNGTHERNAFDVVHVPRHGCAHCWRERMQDARAVRVGVAHIPTELVVGSETITVCKRCMMQPTWVGWANPCGKPVVSIRRAEE